MSAPVLTLQETGELARAVLDDVATVVVGKPEACEQVLLGVLAGGHVLLEDLPGLGKTLLARTFAAVLGLDFARVQFTPDLLPSDLTGAGVYDPRTGEVAFRPGPVFTNILLADEINRTPPKTQAALLEAMGEQQVSIEGVTHRLPQPFAVLATENPVEYEGTYPLPEAQLDRFALRVRMGYLDAEGEVEVLTRRIRRGDADPTPPPRTDVDGVLGMRGCVELVEVSPDLLAYVVALLGATRHHPQVAVGASPRGGLALVQLARARALLQGRSFVLPDDVKALAVAVLGHRIVLRPELWSRRLDGDDVVHDVLGDVPVPVHR